GKSVAAHRLAGFRAAQLQHVPSRRPLAEVVVEAGDTMHLRAREVECVGNMPDRVLVQVAEGFVQRAENGKQAPRLMRGDDRLRLLLPPRNPPGHVANAT